MSIESGSSQPSANERMRPPAKGGWRERYESGRSSPERLLARERAKSAEKKKAANAQESPKTPLDLLAAKLLSLEGNEVQREKLRNDIAEAERLLEQLKQDHEPNIVAVYERELRINERLEVARHLADVYEQIASWGEASRLETHLEEGGEIVNPHPSDAREEALSRYNEEKKLKEEHRKAYKKLGQLDRGRTDEEAQETKGLQADDLTLPYKDRIAFAELKIVKRFSKVKGREPTREELDQLIYGQKQAGHSPLSLGERAGQWFRRLGEVTLGGAFDRFADTSITQAVADYKKLEDEERATTETYEKLDHELASLQKTRERIQEEAKRIDPEKQREEVERVKARFKMETPSKKELVKEGRKLSKEEDALAKKRRLLAREPSQPTEEPLTLKSIRQGGREALELERLAEKKRADAEATKALDFETFRSKIDQGVRKWRVAQFKALAKGEPGAVDPDSEEGQEQENAEIRRLIDSFNEKRSTLLARAENGIKEKQLEATEHLFFGKKGALEDQFDEYGLPKKLPQLRPTTLGKIPTGIADEKYELGPLPNTSETVNDDGTEISFGADDVSVDLSEPQDTSVTARPGLFRRAGESIRQKAKELAVASSLAQEPVEDSNASRARSTPSRIHDAPEPLTPPQHDRSNIARESSALAEVAAASEPVTPKEATRAGAKDESLKNSVDIFEEPPTPPPSIESRRAKYLDVVKPLDVDALKPVISFKASSEPVIPEATELSASDKQALSRAAEKKARKGREALKSLEKQRGGKENKPTSAPQAEASSDTPSAIRNETVDDDTPEVSLSEEPEFIDDLETDEATRPQEVTHNEAKSEPLKNSINIFEESSTPPSSIEPRRAKYLDAVRPLDLDTHTPVVSFKSPLQPAAPKAAELSASDALAMSKAAEKKARKGQKALEASKKQRGIKEDATSQVEALATKSPNVRDEAPEVSISEDSELIENPEAEDETEAINQAIGEEAASLLGGVIEAAIKIPLNASSEARAKLIKESLDKILLSSSDWKTPERKRVLDKIREARDSSMAALQQEDVDAHTRTALNHQADVLTDILELTSRSTRGQEEYVKSRASKKGELALRLTSEQKRDRENARFVESKLIGEMSVIMKNLPDEILGRPTPSELYLHTYKALKESTSLEALYALREELSQQGSEEEAEAINDSIRSAFYTASQAIKGRIPALERLAGRDKEAQERLAVVKQLPDVFEELLLEDPVEQRAHVEEIVRKEYKSLTDELASIDEFFAVPKKPRDLEEQVEQQNLTNKSADIQLTMGAIQNLAEETGIDLTTSVDSTSKQPAQQPLERAA